MSPNPSPGRAHSLFASVRLGLVLVLGLGLTLAVAFFSLTGRAAPDNPTLDPPRNSHIAPPTTTVSITYDEPISAATVTSRTFAVHGMQSGLVTATHGVRGGKIIVTPTRPFHQGELVYAIATTGTLNITGTEPLSATQWQFNAGQVISRCFGGFTDIGAGLPDVGFSSVAWGDYDNDGDLDILLTGVDVSYTPMSRVYRNDTGSFTDIGAGLTGVYEGSVAWGDYDNDGDLDILLTGWDQNAYVSRVYRNDAGSFIDIGADLRGVHYSSVAWGDYDNDGDLDILLAGSDSIGVVSRIYRNDAGSFTDIGAGLTNVSASSTAWGDYDNDGDLDILLTGSIGWPDKVSQVYRNDGGSFTGIGAGLTDVSSSSVGWGDYDNDGDLDILLTGGTGDDPELNFVSRIYRNDDCSPNLALVKAVTPQFAAPGDAITYTLAFSNSGTLTATNVVVTDVVPVSVTVSNIASSGAVITDTGASPPYVWQVQDLAPGESGVITITGQLSPTLSRGVTFTNTATIASAADCDPTNNTSAASVTVKPYLYPVLLDPPRNSHTAPLTTTVSIAYDEPMDAATVTSRTFAVHGMQSGLVTAAHGVHGGRIIVTPTRPFHQGELVYAIATTGTLGLDGTEPLSSTQWQFNAGRVFTRCFGSFANVDAELTDVLYSSVAWGDYDDDDDLDILLTGKSGSGLVSRVYRNDDGSFTDVGAGLTPVWRGSAAWGDYDGDGDLDILLTGLADSGRVSQVYRNDGGSFVDIVAGLPGVRFSSVAWGDYDNDGDLDILLTGLTGSDSISRIYRNDAGSFIDIEAGLPGVESGSVAWGDYDDDGDLDILLTGRTSTGIESWVYRNDGGNFVDSGVELTGVAESSVAWGDYDDDGDLDILLAGWIGGARVSRVYRNDGGLPSGGWAFVAGAGLTGVSSSSAAWGDHDNDGDLDILLTGFIAEGQPPVSKIYRNDGGSSVDVGVDLMGVSSGSAAWGDYDDDGDLDILLTGLVGEEGSDIPVSLIYRNDDCSSPDLALVKTVTTPSTGSGQAQVAAPGQAITYTLTFSNGGGVGALIATGVVITDIVPVSVTVSGVINSGADITATGASPPYVWQVQDLAQGESGVITITGVLSASLPAGVIVNTAVITATMDGDSTDNSSTAILTVANVPPVAADDGYTTGEDTPLAVPAPGVLGNDTDANGDPLAAALDGGPMNGTLALDPDGSFAYTPTLDFNGVDIFTYHADDRTTGSNVAMVIITVTASDDAPVAVNDGYTTGENTPLAVAAPGVLGNDADADDDPLAAVLDSGPVDGALALSSDGSFAYTPTLNFNGVITFTYHADDGTTSSNVATVVITVKEVNYAPVAKDDGYTTVEDTPLTVVAPGVLDNDTDADNNSLAAVLDSGPTNGALALRLDGSFAYTPTLNFYGVDTFTYHADDEKTGSNVATVVITVTAVNDAPGAKDDDYAVGENTPLAVAAPGVLGNDADADGDPLAAVLDDGPVSGPVSGTLAFNSDGSFAYTPTLGFGGVVTFTYHADDGTVDSNMATVTITVNKTMFVYLPLAMRNHVIIGPDLVVESIVATDNAITVTIKNQGDAPVTTAFLNEFWVDVYVDPDVIPTRVNQTWDLVGDQGLVWGVTQDALPLEPGDSLTLTVGGNYYRPDLSEVSWPLPAGAPIWAQVDSANIETDYGAVLEGHEITGGEYNNISGPVDSGVKRETKKVKRKT